MTLDELGLVGNCQLSALVRRDGAIVWSGMPRFDSPPVLGALLDEDARRSFAIGSAVSAPRMQPYLPNTNALEARFDSKEGAFRVHDIAPRFVPFERSFRPTKLVRTVERRRVKSQLGLYSEDLDLATGVMWGSFPQAYSSPHSPRRRAGRSSDRD